MEPTIIEGLARDLAFLYGPERATDLLGRLEERLASLAHRIPSALAAAGRSRLSERDAVLICYADQVSEPGAAPLATLGEFVARHVEDIITAVHLLPFYPSSSDDGFAVKDYYRVESAFGDWPDIEQLGRRMELMFDAVINHASAQGAWFRGFLKGAPEYRDFFVTVAGQPDLSRVIRPRTLPLLHEFGSERGPRRVWTTFSADQVDLNFGEPAVLLAVLEVLLFYVAQGARFLRLDAIAFLWKEMGTTCLHLPQTHRIIQVIRGVLDLVAPGVVLITETNVPHADNVSYFGNGRNEAQMVYNFALPPLLLHALATGSAEQLSLWAKSLTRPSDHVTFFNFLASHDGIGLNPARGILPESEIQALVERTRQHGGLVSDKSLPDGSKAPYELNINYFDALSDPGGIEPLARQVDRFLCAHAVMLSLPGVPGIYFHSLFGSRGDRAGAVASGLPRRINREKVPRSALEADLSNPESLRSRVLLGLKRLLRARQSRPEFNPYGQHEVWSIDPRVFAIGRRGGEAGARLVCLHNVSGGAVGVELAKLGSRGSRHWTDLMAAEQGELSHKGTKMLELPPYGVWWGLESDAAVELHF